METFSDLNGKQRKIGDMLRQQEVWGRIEDMIRLGVATVGIADMLLAECDDIAAHYVDDAHARDNLSRLIRYHVRSSIPLSERIGTAKARSYMERETGGLNVFHELLNAVAVQKERAGRAMELEQRIGITSDSAGREVERYGRLAAECCRLLLAAGLPFERPEPSRPWTSDIRPDAEAERRQYSHGLSQLLRRIEELGLPQDNAVAILCDIPPPLRDDAPVALMNAILGERKTAQ